MKPTEDKHMHYRIKPLEWLPGNYLHLTTCGKYTIHHCSPSKCVACVQHRREDLEIGKFPTLAEAKAACEAHHRAAVEALLEPEEGGELATLVPLSECPPGFFEFEGMIGFKSNYSTNGFCDAFCDTGEYFWGGTCDHEARRKLLVWPVSRIARALSPIPSALQSPMPAF